MNETAAIMMTDLIGFASMARLNENLFKEICAKHKHIHRTSITKYTGRLVHIFRDRSLSIFIDPANAVKCANEIQKSLNEEPVSITGKGKRLLAAIMFTDMAGYTALMQEDEQKAK